MPELVSIARRGAVAIVTLNLPNKRNALGNELCTLLAQQLTAIQDDRSLRALVLSGGPQFCAGGDLDGMKNSALEMRRAMQVSHRIIQALTGGALPAVAAVEGKAYGAGFSLALACDFVIADANTSFCAAFGRVSLVPDFGLLWTLPQRVGIGRAREILMLCEPISGTQAHQCGLVDRLCDTGTVLDTAIGFAERLALQSPASIATTKAVLARLPLNLDTLLAWEADTQSLLLQSEDFQEGVRAFREKRSPRFSGR